MSALSRRSLLASLSALGTASCMPRSLAGGRSTRSPNVVMISVDDLNDWIGTLGGHPGAKTPHMDRLAARGTLFTNAHSQAPLCGPSRASLLTGMLPSTTGIYGHIEDEDIRAAGPATVNVTFLPEQFSRAGYHTMGIGKIFHIGAPEGAFAEWGGRHRGFGPSPEERFHWDRQGTSTDWGAYPASDTLMPDIASALWAAERLEREQTEPFFLAVGFLRPHVPWYVPQKWFDLHPLESVELPPYLESDLDDVPEIARQITQIPVMPTTQWARENEQWRAIVQAYLASVSFVDHCVGLVLNALEAGPHADNTIVLLWSDHGYHLGEKGLFQKFTLWDRSSRVPMIFAGPGIAGGQRRHEPAGLIDIYPTLLALTGIAPEPMAQGASLVPALKGESAGNENTVAITTYGPGNYAVRSARYRYIRYSDGSEELYDHQEDPAEWRNLATDPDHHSVIEQLRAHLPGQGAPWSDKTQIRISPYFDQRYKD